MAKKDEFDDEGFFDRLQKSKKQVSQVKMPKGLRRLFILIAAMAVVIVLISVIWSAVPVNSNSREGPLPVFRADGSPYKIKPEDPGGMAVPNKDSTIFETLKNKNEGPTIENLLEDNADTSAAAREEVTAKLETKTEPLVDVRLDNSEAIKPEIVESEKPEIQKEAQQPSEETSIIETLREEAKPQAERKEVVPVAKPVARGSTYIQLASVKSEADANKQWSAFKAKNPELASLTLRVQKADLGNKGIYYRVQAGSLSPDSAQSTCASIKSRGGNCLVVK